MIIYIRIIEAKELPQCDFFSKNDSYCLVQISGNKRIEKTKIIKNSLSPYWFEEFKMYFNDQNDILHILIKDYDYGTNDDNVSKLEIPLFTIPEGIVIDKWYSLNQLKNKGYGGQIHLILHIVSDGDSPFISRIQNSNQNISFQFNFNQLNNFKNDLLLIDYGENYYITLDINFNFVIDIDLNNNLILWNKNSQRNQIFNINKNIIMNIITGLVIDFYDNNLILNKNNYSFTQQWIFYKDGTIKNQFGQCIDIKFGEIKNNSEIILSNFSGSNTQKWRLIKK